MPARNAAATVGIALRSVLRSRHDDFEVIVADHASTDRTREIVERLAHGAAGRVRIVDAPASLDLAAVLELGRAVCRGELIARFDADDVMHPDRLAADARTLAPTSDAPVDAVCCRVKVLRSATSTTTPGMRAYVAWQNAALTPDDHAREIWIEQPLCQPSTTMRASSLERVGGYRSGPFPEDYELFLRLIVSGARIVKRPEVHHGWRQHALTNARYDRDAFARLKARALVARHDVHQRSLFVCGAGKEGRRIARALADEGVQVTAFFDVHVDKIGKVRRGAPVLDASLLASERARHPNCFAIGAVVVA